MSTEPNVEIKADLSESANKIINNTFEGPTKEAGKALGTVLGFFNNTILYPFKKYNLYAESKLQKYAKDLENKVLEIPESRLVESSVNILGPAMEGLKYNLEEEHIKEMFTNIIVSDMDSSKKTKVIPAYIEIVKQLSREDALFLKKIKESVVPELYAIKTKYVLEGEYSFIPGEKFFMYNKEIIESQGENVTVRSYEGRTEKINQFIIDNLERLNLVELQFGEFFTDENTYNRIFQEIEPQCNRMSGRRLKYDKGKLSLTELGKNLLDICFDS